MSLKNALRSRPVIYEIVPPKRDTSRFTTEIRGIEGVLHDGRIDAVNIPELMTRRKTGGQVSYSPTTIPPEEYALMIKEYKEPMVNIIAPRLPKEEFLGRSRRVLRDFGIRNLVIVGKERHDDDLPGPSVADALGLLREDKADDVTLGAICIFDRRTGGSDEHPGPSLSEAKRVWTKAEAGCDFVTSQITFDPAQALSFLAEYRGLCDETGSVPLTVFVSLTTIPTPSILSLIEGLDVVIPPSVRRRLASSGDMGRESLSVAAEVFQRVVSESDRRRDGVPLGLQVEQVGVNSAELSLDLLDRVHSTI